MQELESRQQRMIAEREQSRDGSLLLPGVQGGDYNLDIDVTRNVPVVTTKDANPEATATFKSRYGEDVIVEEGDIGGPEACTRTDCRYDLRSGLKTVQSNGAWCSTAFTVKRSDGTRNILSAAHCGGGDVGSARFHGGERYGEVKHQNIGFRVDAERHGPPEGSFAMKPWIYVNDSNKERPVQQMSTWSGLRVGLWACKSGARTDKSCGNITSKHFSPSWVSNSERFVKADYCADGGDSGSGVYKSSNWNKVHGIHSGGGSGGCGDPDDWSAFGHIEYALNSMGVTLVTL